VKCHNCDFPSCYRDGKECKDLKEVFEKLTPLERELLTVSSDIEREYYGVLTRLEELLEFAKRMGFKKIGIAFCIGLFEETKIIAKIFENHGFTVYSAACKIGAVDKAELNIEKIQPQNLEASCNPVGQAFVLNEKNTDMNIVIGLCVGHDMLFNMHSKAPTTTLIVKDRVLAHNPAGAVYSKYHRRKLLSPSETKKET
jgi:uncharacterized metal-binding protein